MEVAFGPRRGRHIEAELPGARVLFTTREGGVSAAPYDSLNLGRGTGDDRAAVAANRAKLAEIVGRHPVFMRQVHGSHVALFCEVPAPSRGVADGIPMDADGSATLVPEIAPAVLTADCLPVALAGGGAVAVVHAGWRGLAGGILAAGVRAIRELTGGSTTVGAVIGPGAGACCYEVGDEVRAAFSAHGTEVRHGRHIDLKAIARRELEAAGATGVDDVELCTICSASPSFFSHRRDGGVTGRQAGIAWLT